MTTGTLTGSDRLVRRASRSIPGGVNTAKRRPRPPLCVRRAEGGHIEDVDIALTAASVNATASDTPNTERRLRQPAGEATRHLPT